MSRFSVLRDPSTVAEAIADRFVRAARDAIEERGVFRVALSGGGTPKQVYPLLLEPSRRDAVDWSNVEFFWGDERAVPPDHPESNFGVAYGMLISQLPDVRPDRAQPAVLVVGEVEVVERPARRQVGLGVLGRAGHGQRHPVGPAPAQLGHHQLPAQLPLGGGAGDEVAEGGDVLAQDPEGVGRGCRL